MGQVRLTADFRRVLTSPTNLGSLVTGDTFVGDSALVYIVQRNDQRCEGARVVAMSGQAAVVDHLGQPTPRIMTWRCGPNIPMDRIVGGRAGGHL